MIMKDVKAHEGDFRDWDDIRAWAITIAAELALDARAQERGSGS